MGLLDHLLALGVGLALGIGVVFSVVPAQPRFDLGSPPNWFKDYSSAPDVDQRFEHALSRKDALVMIGTCDLNVHEETPNLPATFFPAKLGIPTFAIGKGGMQSLAILGQLAAFYDLLKERKLVLLVSLEWFSDAHPRTGVPEFLEFVPDALLDRMLYRSSVPSRYIDRVASFVAESSSKIDRQSLTLKYLAARGKGDGLREALYKGGAFSADFLVKEKLTRRLERFTPCLERNERCGDRPGAPTGVGTGGSVAWDELRQEALRLSLAREAKAVALPVKTDRPLADTPELADFTALADLLKESGARPLVIIQGVNPRSFVHASEFSPVAATLGRILRERGISFLDLRKDSYPAGYFWGLRIGDVQWVEINRGIATHLGEGK